MSWVTQVMLDGSVLHAKQQGGVYTDNAGSAGAKHTPAEITVAAAYVENVLIRQGAHSR